MSNSKRGFTLIELLVVVSIIALLIGILLPAIGKARDGANVTESLTNLRNFGAAHQTYQSEWNGRQWTTCPDDLTQILNGGGTGAGAYQANYASFRPFIPAVPLGFDRNGMHHERTTHGYIVPMWDPRNCSLGNFRFFHSKPFNTYINSKVFDPIFWAPKDYTIEERLWEFCEDPGEWAVGGIPYFSTYCMSVAAQVSPMVYEGRGRRANALSAGHRSPSYAQARYPDLKTHMLEHYWLQNNPSESIPGTNGVPWFFNMSPDSSPATLFFDGHVRLMSVREAVQSSNKVVQQGGEELDAPDRGCFGTGGYFESYAYSGTRSEINSYHVFTRDGIAGRDTTQGG